MLNVRQTLPASRERFWWLAFVFGCLSFVQGLAEPTEGLPAQPIRSLLLLWGRTPTAVATFSALVAVPWFFKPVFGLVADFVPIAGSRRKGHLIASSFAAAGAFLWLWAMPLTSAGETRMLAWLVVATAAVAFSDVAADALMVERGQALGQTGRFQAVQWASSYGSGLLAGSLGGALSEAQRQDLVFLICAVGTLGATGLSVFIKEPAGSGSLAAPRDAMRALRQAVRSRAVLAVAGFLFLWNFNPFSTVVLHLHMTRALHFREQFYGHSLSLLSLTSIAACVAYGFYSRRLPMRVLADASVALGVFSTLGYLALSDERSAIVVTLAIGFTYMTATLIQLDLAAQACPTEAAGTVFATLMAIANASMIVSAWLGGLCYEHGTAQWGSGATFRVLVVTGSAFTAGGWLLVPQLIRGLAEERRDPADSPSAGNR